MKQQQTLTEINQAEVVARQRALDYENLLSAQHSCAAGVRIVSEKIFKQGAIIKSIGKLLKSAESVDPEIETVGRALSGFGGAVPLVAKGLCLKSLIVSEATAALAAAEQHRDVLTDSLMKVRAKQIEVEAALDKFSD